MTDTLAGLLALHKQGDLTAAEQGYRRMATCQGDPNAMQLLAVLLHQTRRHREALHWLDLALPELQPQTTALSNRAAILLALERYAEAVQCCDTLLAQNPRHEGGRLNRQLALLGMAEQAASPDQALPHYQDYLATGGEDPLVLRDYANALQHCGQAEAAVPFYQRACDLAPEDGFLASAAFIAEQFCLPTDFAKVQQLAQRAANCYVAAAVSSCRPQSPVDSDQDTWGFYSPRLGDGPMASLVLPVLTALQQRGIRIVLFAGHNHGEQAAGFKAIASQWHDVSNIDDAAFAALVQASRVGVMFDLCGHAPGNRMAAFARRLAPLQLSWGDWFATTGLAAMDYFVGDEVTTPPAMQAYFSERLVYMDAGRFVYQPSPTAPAASLQPPAQPLYASFNRLSKLTQATAECWAALLQTVPQANLLLRSDGLQHLPLQATTAARFADLGVDPSRLRFAGYDDYATVLAAYNQVSVALDPFPFNGCVTTFDALAMAVPVVALQGNSLVARQSAGILNAAGCGDWVAHSAQQYIDIAAMLVQQEPNQSARARLAQFSQGRCCSVGAFAQQLIQHFASTR